MHSLSLFVIFIQLTMGLQSLSVEQKIVLYTSQTDIPVERALAISECESQHGKYLYNQQGSSAKGIYQFISKTWENYCEGDVLDEDANIKCFLKLYKQHSNWWECSNKLYGTVH
jgi:hypothetical protein